MAKATLINQTGNKVVVDSGSSQANQYFGQGYKLMGATNNPVPSGATKIAGPSGLQGLNESQLFRQGQDIYKLPSVAKTLTSEQVTGGIPDVQATSQAENYLPNYVAGQNKYMEMVMGDLTNAQADVKKQEELATTTNAKLGDLYEKAGLKGTEYTSELEKYNYGNNVTQLQEVNKQIASKNAEFTQAINAQEGRAGIAGSIYGRQALIQRQQASQIGALSSIAQALQGNITLAQQTAKDALDIKYSSIENEIEQTKSQIESIYENLDRADKKKADSQLLALEERTRVLNEQKEKDGQINEVMLSAAQAGATVDTLNKIMKSKTLGEAIINSGQYLRTSVSGNWEKLTDSAGNEVLVDTTTGEIISGNQASNVSAGVVSTATGDAYDIGSYATDPTHEMKIQTILNNIGQFKSVNDIDNYINTKYPNSPVTGKMIEDAANEYGVSWEMMVAIMAQDSSMGTAGKAVRTKNPGNVGNTDDGSTKTFGSWAEGVKSVAKNLAWRKTTAVTPATPVGTITDTVKSLADAVIAGNAKLSDIPQKDRPAVIATIQASGQNVAELEQKQKTAESTKNEAVSIIDTLLNSKSIGSATGFSSWTTKIKGTNAYSFGRSFDQLRDLLAMGNIDKLKGAMSDKDIEFLRNSATKLALGLPKDEFKAELNKLKTRLQNPTSSSTDVTQNSGTTSSGVSYTIEQ